MNKADTDESNCYLAILGRIVKLVIRDNLDSLVVFLKNATNYYLHFCEEYKINLQICDDFNNKKLTCRTARISFIACRSAIFSL